MSEKTILDQVFEWFHNFWYGQPEQTQHEGTSTTDEAGETAEVTKGGGIVETIQDEITEERTVETSDRSLPRERGFQMVFEGVIPLLARNKKTAIIALVAAILIVVIYFAVKGFRKAPEET